MTAAEYIGKMKALGDEMAAAGRALDDEELVEYILIGLDMDFNQIVSGVDAHTEPITVLELYAQLLAFEIRMNLMHNGYQSSANMAGQGSCGNNASRGRGGRSGRGHGTGGAGRGRGSRGAAGNQQHNSGSNYNNCGGDRDTNPLCQVCFKKGPTAPAGTGTMKIMFLIRETWLLLQSI